MSERQPCEFDVWCPVCRLLVWPLRDTGRCQWCEAPTVPPDADRILASIEAAGYVPGQLQMELPL